ncbi:hypothetical protein QT384_02780 [Arcobacter cryaerophilus gv. pseudocryaerophilus]|uniref:Uncharacterized protein n=3 Tax=Arcobacteraceae TaxID=2808963 RepID=A0AA96DSK7_9BACT|nr:hypothetical protein RMP68_09855 [Arcobacter sp. AZ-2023]WNL36731.1 hypothetical protein RMQ66_02780 [Arcobacter sp. AZ-2023]WPD12447.1 hypothetical protein QT384_02780 [Arcobacter sp. DSM 115960]
MQLSKYTQENDKVLTVIDRKMIFKVDDNFFIDDKGIKSFTEKNIENIVPLKLNQEVHYAKKYIRKCTRSENGIISLDFKEDIYNFLKSKGYDEEECYVSNGSFLVACYLMGVPVNHTEDTFAEVFLEKPLKEYVIKPTKNKTFFGLEIYQGNLVKENDIKKLPFYDFWYESSKGSTYAIIDDEEYVYLSDFESFSKLFIKTGKHRFQKGD